MPVIEYCLSNVDEETRRRLAARTDARERPCLEHCGICYRDPFLVIDGRIRRGERESLLAATESSESDSR